MSTTQEWSFTLIIRHSGWYHQKYAYTEMDFFLKYGKMKNDTDPQVVDSLLSDKVEGHVQCTSCTIQASFKLGMFVTVYVSSIMLM